MTYTIVAKLLKAGQVTVPKNIREALSLETGDMVEFEIIRKVPAEKRGPAF